MALPYTGYKRFFFLKCDVCGEILVGLKADTSSARAEATGCEATRENDDRFFEGINPIFARVFHLIRLGRKRKPRKKSLWHPG